MNRFFSLEFLRVAFHATAATRHADRPSKLYRTCGTELLAKALSPQSGPSTPSPLFGGLVQVGGAANSQGGRA